VEENTGLILFKEIMMTWRIVILCVVPIACANKMINGEMAVLNDVVTYFCSEANKQTVIFKRQFVFGCEITGWQMCADHVLFR